MTKWPINCLSAWFKPTLIALLFLAVAHPTHPQSIETARQHTDQTKKVRVNGVELNYLERGKGTPVIFVHGGLDDYRYWNSELEPFSERYRVITYSRRYNYPNNNPLTRLDHSANEVSTISR